MFLIYKVLFSFPRKDSFEQYCLKNEKNIFKIMTIFIPATVEFSGSRTVVLTIFFITTALVGFALEFSFLSEVLELDLSTYPSYF